MEIERDFGTDFGTCCWYTPQINLTEVKEHQNENNLEEPDWGHWFSNLKKAHSNWHFMYFDVKSAVSISKFI